MSASKNQREIDSNHESMNVGTCLSTVVQSHNSHSKFRHQQYTSHQFVNQQVCQYHVEIIIILLLHQPPPHHEGDDVISIVGSIVSPIKT